MAYVIHPSIIKPPSKRKMKSCQRRKKEEIDVALPIANSTWNKQKIKNYETK